MPARVEPVEPARALRLVDDQARLLEHLQVLGDRRTADGEPAGELADRLRAVGQRLEDRAPRRVRERACSPLVMAYRKS